MNLISWLWFEFAFFKAAAKHFNHYSTGTAFIKIGGACLYRMECNSFVVPWRKTIVFIADFIHTYIYIYIYTYINKVCMTLSLSLSIYIYIYIYIYKVVGSLPGTMWELVKKINK